MDRRKFLKMLGFIPAATVLPASACIENDEAPLENPCRDINLDLREVVFTKLRVISDGQKFTLKHIDTNNHDIMDFGQCYLGTWYLAPYDKRDGPIPTMEAFHCREAPDAAIHIYALDGDILLVNFEDGDVFEVPIGMYSNSTIHMVQNFVAETKNLEVTIKKGTIDTFL